MHENATDKSDIYLSSEELTFTANKGMEQAGRVVVTKAVAQLAVDMCLDEDDGNHLVQAFRDIEIHDQESAFEASLEIAAAVDNLREVLRRRGAVVVRAAELADNLSDLVAVVPTNDLEPTSITDVDVVPVILQEEQVPVTDDETNENREKAASIQLSKRGIRYVQSIFGSLDDLRLHDGDKAIVAQTICELRGSSKRRNDFVDMTPRLMMMFEGFKDAEIAQHVKVSPPSVAVSFSNLAKKIKEQPGYSYAHARSVLESNLKNTSQEADEQTDNVNVEPDESSEEAHSKEGGIPEFRQSLQTGKLIGAIRRHLRKSGHDHTIPLDETVLSAYIDAVFEKQNATPQLQSDYLTYLARGTKPLVDTAINECIARMHEYIAKYITSDNSPAQTTNVLPITTPTHHTRTASVTPRIMPQHRVLSFEAPRNKAAPEQVSFEYPEVVNGNTINEMPLLITAAYQEGMMSQEDWYKLAYEQIQTAAQLLEMTDVETEALWGLVHFNGKRKNDDGRSSAEREAVKKLESRMIDYADRLERYPELQRCIKKFLNNFSPNDLMSIQQALKKDNPAIYERAAQRYVVAGIVELTKE